MVEIIHSIEVRRRWEFGLLCNCRGLMYGRAIEIGTGCGWVGREGEGGMIMKLNSNAIGERKKG